MAISTILPPLGGVGRQTAYQTQQPFECYDAVNFWPIDPKTGRAVFANRPPLQEIGAPTPTAPSIINMITPVNGVRSGYPFESLVIAASDGDGDADGKLYVFDGTVWVAATGTKATAVDDHRAIYAASIISDVYVPVVGAKPVRFRYSTGAAETLVETAGTCPSDTRMAVVWQGALVLAGNTSDPNILYMSRVGDPLDWDFTVGLNDLGGAFFTDGEDEGRIAGPITAIMPQTGDTLIVSALTGMIAMRGHPREGGVFEPISTNFYALGQGAWAKVPGDVLFILTKQGLVRLDPQPGAVPTVISKTKVPVELLGLTYDIEDPTVTMAYDSRWNGLVITVRGNNENQAWWYDLTNGGFFRMRFESYPWVAYEHPPFLTDATSGTLFGRYDGIHRFDLFGTDETMPTSAIIGPVRISRDDHSRSKIQKLRVLFGRDTPSSNIVGVLRVATGVDGQDAVSKVLRDEHQYQISLSALRGANGVCYPLCAGGAAAFAITTEAGEVSIEQMTADVTPVGLSPFLRTTQISVTGSPTSVFTDVGFAATTWTGYSEATPDAASCELPGHSCFIDLSTLPASWWAQVASDGGDVRASDGDNQTLPMDLVEFNAVTKTGFVVVKADQGATPTAIRLWAGRPGMAQPAPDNAKGQYNAYDANWGGFWPDGGGNDRTVNQKNFTHVNSTAGDSTGPIGALATDYDESNHGGNDAYGFIDNPAVADEPVTLVAFGKRNASGTSLDFFGIGSGQSDHHRVFLNWDGGDISFARAVTFVSPTSGQADSSPSGELVTTWQHVAATFPSGAARHAFINGGGKGSNTTALAPTAFEQLMIGRARSKSIVSTTYNGKISLAQIHNVERSDCWLAYQASMRDQSAFWNGWGEFVTVNTPEEEPAPVASACPSGIVSVSETGTWAGYDELTAAAVPATAENLEVLLEFSHWVDLSLMSATWWANVKTDGSDIRATNGSDVFHPVDLVAFDHAAKTGFLVVRGASNTTAGLQLRLWVGNASAVTVPACAAYGRYRAYDRYTEGFWPSGGGEDRTQWQRTLTASGGASAGNIAGPAGLVATRYDGVDDYYDVSTVPAVGTSNTDGPPITLFTAVRVNPPDTWPWASAVSLVNDDNHHYAFYVTPSIEPMEIVIHAVTDQWLTNPERAALGSWISVTCGFALDTLGNLHGRIIADTNVKAFSATQSGLLTKLAGLNRFTLGTQRLSNGNTFGFLDGDLAFPSLHSVTRPVAWSLYNRLMLTQSTFWTTPTWTASASNLPQP